MSYSNYSQINAISNFKFQNSTTIDTSRQYGVYNNTGNSLFTFPAITDLSNGNFTVEFYINNQSDISISNGKFILSIQDNSSNILEFRFGNSGINRIQMFNGSGSINRYYTAGTSFNNFSISSVNFHHIAFVYRGSDSLTTNFLYINGVQIPNSVGFSNDTTNYVNSNGSLTRVSVQNNISLYLLSDVNNSNQLISSNNNNIFNLRISNSAVYTTNFTKPTTQLLPNTPNCIFLLQTYTSNGITKARDAISQTDLNMLGVNTSLSIS